MSKMDYTEENLENLGKLYKINSISDKIEYYA